MTSESIPVELVGVRIELPSNQPIVLLKEMHGTRYLPIWIGAPEATAIAFALEEVETQRPLTHDLLKQSIEALGARIDRIVVTELRDGIYYADLVFGVDSEEVVVSSRPSDAIALALRTDALIFVEEEVVKKAHSLKYEENLEDSEKFKKWLDSLKPEDFGKYKM